MSLGTAQPLDTKVGNGTAWLSNQLFNQGLKGLTGAMDSYSNRVKNRAINNVLSMEQAKGEDANGYSARVNVGLSNIDGLDPLQRLQLRDVASKPIYDQEARDLQAQQQLFNNSYKTDTLNETTRHNQATENKIAHKGYGMISDDLGNFYQYNKDDGSYKLVQQAGANGINPHNVSLKPVTSRDSSGVETTTYVPFNKMTGQPINNAQGTATKYPTIANSDKTYRDDMPVINSNIANLEKMINNPAYSSSFGIADNAIDSTARWAGLETEGANKNAEINAISSNLLAGFGKAQMAGVLTDQDMKIIKQQIPSASDSPATAKKKMAFIKDLMAVRNKSWSDRLNQSNPGWLQKSNTPTAVPPGMKMQVNTETGETRYVPVGG